MSKQSKRKGRVIKSASKSYKSTYIVVGIVAAIIAAASAWYIYSSARSTTTTSLTNLTDTSSSGFVYAIISTSKGTMEAELFKNETPTTVNNFVSLADSGFYNNLIWHRIVGGFVIQTGDPTSKNGGGAPCQWGGTGSTKTIPLEIVPYLHNYEGYLGMARASANNTGSSQFYINLADNSGSLDGRYTVFGKLISGLSAAQAIGSLPVQTCTGIYAGNSPPQDPSQALVSSITIQNSP